MALRLHPRDVLKVEVIEAVDRHGRITDVYDSCDPDREAVEGTLLVTMAGGASHLVPFDRR